MNIDWVREKISSGQYLWTLHADAERRNDALETEDIENAILNGEILERYEKDPRGCSCLICGDSKGVPIHVVCGKNMADLLIIITVYKPSLPKWLNPNERREK